MIDIKRKEDCCGCGACYDACAKQAILWEVDEEGFSYPKVDAFKCVNCGLCNKVCPIENSEAINHINNSSPVVKGAYHKNEEIRFTSTSGGAFWGLAEPWLKAGGYVAGAIFDEQFNVCHIVTNKIEELEKIKGSKYCQSDSRGIYKQIKSLLNKGERVMATGLPCQMAAMRQFLQKEYDNLLIVDIICHSVPSPKLFQEYIKYLEKMYKSRMTKYHPKNKELGGWHHFSFKAWFENGEIYHRADDVYTSVAFNSVMARRSCFECHFKHIPQPSDITIGDFWGIENVDASFDSPKGVSKIMLNNEKGKKYFQSLDCFVTKEYGLEESVINNKRAWPQIQPTKRCDEKKRQQFLTDLENRGIVYAATNYTMQPHSVFGKIKKLFKLKQTKYVK